MKTSIIRFPTEKCRLPGESREMFALRRLLIGKKECPFYAGYDAVRWDPPLLDELAQGVQDSYPYP